jgi:hypothetical protein
MKVAVVTGLDMGIERMTARLYDCYIFVYN